MSQKQIVWRLSAPNFIIYYGEIKGKIIPEVIKLMPKANLGVFI